jgi:hypothetical protein
MVAMRGLVVVILLTGCYRTEEKPAPASPVTTAPVEDAPRALPREATVDLADDRLYASLSKPERIAFCEQERPGTHDLSLEDMRLGLCRLEALQVLVTRMATALAARDRCRASVARCCGLLAPGGCSRGGGLHDGAHEVWPPVGVHYWLARYALAAPA